MRIWAIGPDEISVREVGVGLPQTQFHLDNLSRCASANSSQIAFWGTLRLLKVNPKMYDEISVAELKDAKTGRSLLEYPCWAAPVLSHGLLYVRGEGRLVCLELIPKRGGA